MEVGLLRLRHTLILVSLLASVPVMAQDTEFYTPPVASVPLVQSAPQVDGIINPQEWAGAVKLTPFITLGGREVPSRATDVWVMYTTTSLYIAAVMHDPDPENLVAGAVERDGPVWQDDSIELFFDTEGLGQEYIHFIVNSAGVQYDAFGTDKSADYRWTAKTAVLANGWSCELELPFANNYPPGEGVSWGFAICRNSVGARENSSWVRVLNGFHEIANFGSLVFSGSPLSMEIATLGSRWLGANTAQVTVRNRGNRTETCKINTRVMSRDKYGHFFDSIKLDVPPGGTLTQAVPYTIKQDGFSHVTFSLTDETGETVMRSAPYPVLTPEVQPVLEQVEATLAAAMREWMLLPAGEGKDRLRADLDTLGVQWRHLVKAGEGRERMSEQALNELAAAAMRLQRDAAALKARISSGERTGNPDASFGAAAVSSLQRVLPGEYPPVVHELQLDMARYDREAGQVVVFPFPA